MPDFIPRDDANKLLWLANFNLWLGANGLTHGFTAGEITAFDNAYSDASAAVVGNTSAQAAARATTVDKNAKLGAAVSLARADVQRLQNHPATTDADRAAAGVTVPDTIPTPADPNFILTVPPPLLLLDFGVRRQVTIHWGPNPGDEANNGRPVGTIGCQVQQAKGGIPVNEALWFPVDTDPESPLLHLIDDQQPVTIAYRGRYVGKNLKYGPFGDPVVCTVSA